MHIRILLFLMSSCLAFAEPIPLEHGTSPDGKYRLEVAGSGEDPVGGILKLRELTRHTVAGSLTFGSYAAFPYLAEPDNTACLWAPDSKHFAMMARGTKRSWRVGVYSVGGAMRTLPMPGFTDFALKQVRQDSIFRWSRETPIRWLDKGHLALRLEGDCGTPPNIIRYSGEISVSISDGKISLIKPFGTSKEEG